MKYISSGKYAGQWVTADLQAVENPGLANDLEIRKRNEKYKVKPKK